MHSSLPITLLALVATALFPSIYANPLTAHRPRSTCNSVTTGQADRRGASGVAEQLITEANAADDRQSGGVLTATPEYKTVARFAWRADDDKEHETYVQIRVLPDATIDTAAIDRRNVYGTVMDLIMGCSNRSCVDDGCPVSGEAVPPSDPVVQVRLTGNLV